MFNYILVDKSKVEYIEIAPISELPDGGRLFVEIADRPIVVFNIAGGLFAIGDVCTHDNGPLGDGDLDGLEIVCPRHGAKFDVRTGKATGMPAVEDIPAYPVQVKEGNIFVGIPKK